VDMKRVGKRPLEMLARAGAFDELDRNRRRVFDSLDALVNYSAAVHEQRSSNQVSLFGEAGDDLPEPRMSPAADWQPAERLAEEFKAIGFYLSGHPLDDYMAPLKRSGVVTLDELREKVQNGPLVAKLAGTVASRQERKSARGNRFAFVQLSDTTGNYEVTMFSDTLETAREHLETGSKVVIGVEATLESDQLKLLGRSVQPIDGVVAQAGGAGLRVYVDNAHAIPSVATVLRDAIRATKNAPKGPISFCLLDDNLPGEVDMDLGQDFPVSPQIKGALKSLDGVLMVEEV
ncbi:MAG: OB-fold nucleic acid binding domain-containing protein, partial [Planktomarina sp.]